MVTNALRHGFPNDRSGTVSVEGAAENGRLRITIADDGVGLPEGFHPEAMKGLGMRLTTSIANGFGTPLVWSTPEAGASFSFYVPLDAAQPL
jgi:two-component sensor histidine kinase